MSLNKRDEEKFEDMCKAAVDGRLVLLECKDKKTGDYRAVICICEDVNGEYQIEPLAHMAPGNPFEEYTPPGNPREVIIPGTNTEN